jgi:protocatechuate 3,4-dioxygenase beta subunit
MRLALTLVCLAAIMRAAASQVPAAAKDPSQASLEGKVIKEPAGEPIKKAIIEMIGENQEEGGNYTATSDPEGHFMIAGIRPGRYRIFVERTGYIEVDAKRRHSDGVVLSLDAGQELKDETLHMLPAAIVMGRVLDEDGDPMSNVEVTVLRRKFSSGQLKLEPRGSSQTNDLGEFRIGGLLAGKYYISATPMPNFQSVVHEIKTPDEPGASQPDTAYVTTYYPNTTNRAQAASLEIHAGDETPADFSLSRVHTARVRGSVAGLAPGAKAVVMLRERDASAMYTASEVDPEGKFELQHVAPGTYTVAAMSLMPETSQVATETIEVTDSNVDGLRLIPVSGATVRGKLRLTGSIGKSDASLFVVYLHRADGEEEFPGGMASADESSVTSLGGGRVKADGSFELKNVPPGVYDVGVYGDSKGMNDSFVESVVAGQKDVTDGGLRVNGGTASLDVTFTTGAAALEGAVTNDKNEPIADATVIAVPEEKYRQQQGRYGKASADQHGHFTMRGLRPGAYTLLAWETLDGDDCFDAEYLKKYEGGGTPIRLKKSAHSSISLKAIPAASDQP